MDQAKVISGKKRLWDNYAVVGEVRKSDSIKFVVAAGIRDGVRYINIREFYFRKRDGVWNPSKDGITIPLTVPIEGGAKLITPYEALIALFLETVDKLETMELMDENNAVYIEMKGKKNG